MDEKQKMIEYALKRAKEQEEFIEGLTWEVSIRRTKETHITTSFDDAVAYIKNKFPSSFLGMVTDHEYHFDYHYFTEDPKKSFAVATIKIPDVI